MDAEYLHKRLDEWIADMKKPDPNYEAVELSIEFSGRCVGHDMHDVPMYSMSIKTHRIENRR